MTTHIKYIVFIGVQALVFPVLTSCSSEKDKLEGQENSSNDLLTIRAGVSRSSENYLPFKTNDIIHVYYAANDISNIHKGYQGLYQMQEASPQIDHPWVNCNETETDGPSGIYISDIIKYTNVGSSGYYFTATSYPEPISKTYPVYNEVNSQQNGQDAYTKSDFLVSRAAYTNKSWANEGGGLTLHFRHVLSQLRVKLILPVGNVNDGGFQTPENLKISVNIKNKHTHYKVAYVSSNTGTVPMETALPDEASGPQTTDIGMWQQAKPEKVTASGRESWCHTFLALLPNQSMYESATAPLLTFEIAGKKYQYIPKEQNTIELAQNKITTVTLTVLSGIGNQQVVLNKVTMEDWVTDKADIGNLVPQK